MQLPVADSIEAALHLEAQIVCVCFSLLTWLSGWLLCSGYLNYLGDGQQPTFVKKQTGAGHRKLMKFSQPECGYPKQIQLPLPL